MRRLTLVLLAVAATAVAAPAAAQAPAVTLAIGNPTGGPDGTVTTVRYGQVVEVSGELVENRGPETVEVTITPYRGQPTTRVVTSAADGEFSITHRPTIRTSYVARWRGIVSEQEPFAHVRPGLGLRVRNARLGRFVVTLQARRQDASRVIWFQRRVGPDQWRTVKRVRLRGNRLGAAFTARLPFGIHRVRAFIPQTPGYLRATSPFVRVRGFGR